MNHAFTPKSICKKTADISVKSGKHGYPGLDFIHYYSATCGFFTADNFAKQFKALGFRTPYEAVEELFIVKPNHHMLGLNT